MPNRKEQICTLLKGIETGDPASVTVVNQEKYIQHNPQTHEGGEGLAVLFKRLSQSNPRVNIVRVFADGDYVFAHTEYDFSHSNIGFEVFRFEGEYAVEHWDNIQRRQGPNTEGYSMVDGPTHVCDLGNTEAHRHVVSAFVNKVLIGGQVDALKHYINEHGYTEHNPRITDNMSALRQVLSAHEPSRQYQKSHRILAEGNFVLAVSEGVIDGAQASFYDLFRLSSEKIVEHWDTTEKVPPRSEWKNDNGKF